MKLTHENYFSVEAGQEYMSASLYKKFVGTKGLCGCEAMAYATVKGEYSEDPSEAMIIGSYVDSHFSGTLDVFKAQNPQILLKSGVRKGELKSDFRKADKMIKKVEDSPFMMTTLSGETQVIMTAEFFGCKWKSLVDSYHKDVAIVDLKTCKSISESKWVKDFGPVSFIEYFGYIEQLAIYQNIVKVNEGKTLPCFITAVSKEDEPDIEVIYIDDQMLKSELMIIEKNMPRIINIIGGDEKPLSCGHCRYCRMNKKVSRPINLSQIVFKT